jgi:hypothetical protein
MDWTQLPFDSIVLEGISRVEFTKTWAPHMELWRPVGLPDGTPHYQLTALRFVEDRANFLATKVAPGRQVATNGKATTNGINVPMTTHVYCQRAGGAPDPGIVAIQYWIDGPQLQPSLLPLGGLPPCGLEDHGTHGWTDAFGVAEWTWGPGEGFDPITTRGAHTYWITKDDAGKDRASDVVVGFGWRLGTNHFHLEPIFTRILSFPPPPPSGTIPDILRNIADLLADLALLYEEGEQ